jgi:integrase/recombinase XerD
MNNFLLKSLSDANDKLLEFESNRNDHSAKTVRKRVQHSSGVSFFKQAEIYLEDLKKCGKYNCEVNAACRLERFKEFLKGEDIVFPDITVALLTRYRAYLKGTRKNKDKPIKERTIINHLIAIRSVFSQAIKAKIVDEKYYPFGKDKVALKFPESMKIGFSIDEVKVLEELELKKDSYKNHAKNIWLFAFYFAGMRVSDVLRLRWSDFQDDRLHYEMGKNAKGGSLKVPEKALGILKQYEHQKRD